MKICLIGPTYPFRGGISHYTTLLYRCLQKRHQVRFLAFSRQYPRWLFPGKTDKDQSQAHIQAEGAQRVLDSFNPASWLRVGLLASRMKPDLVVIPWWVSFWTPQFLTIARVVKALGKARILFICHNVVEHESKRLDRVLTRTVLKNGDFFIVHSEEDRDNLLEIVPHARVRKTFHPTYDIFNSSDGDLTEFKKTLGLDGNTLLFFGFVREYKGLKYLLEAVPEILSRVPVKLLVVGEFWKDRGAYSRIVDELGIGPHITFIDEYVPNEDVGKYFRAADLVVQPYTSATGSGIIQIAFGFNKPVVATRVGCLPEVIEDGKTGYLVAPRSSSELASVVIRFFEEKRAEEFSENIKRINYKFSWDRLVDVAESFLREPPVSQS